VAFAPRDLFRERLTADEIGRLAALAPGGVRSLLSTRSAPYRVLGLDAKRVSDRELIALMAEEPRLLRRPLVVADRRLIIGFDRRAFDELG
jgi:regulatory protein spx